MSELKPVADAKTTAIAPASAKTAGGEKPVWQTPKLEDVSEQVMAQPYIRFT
jgi:hypothetical protein